MQSEQYLLQREDRAQRGAAHSVKSMFITADSTAEVAKAFATVCSELPKLYRLAHQAREDPGSLAA